MRGMQCDGCSGVSCLFSVGALPRPSHQCIGVGARQRDCIFCRAIGMALLHPSSVICSGAADLVIPA